MQPALALAIVDDNLYTHQWRMSAGLVHKNHITTRYQAPYQLCCHCVRPAMIFAVILR